MVFAYANGFIAVINISQFRINCNRFYLFFAAKFPELSHQGDFELLLFVLLQTILADITLSGAGFSADQNKTGTVMRAFVQSDAHGRACRVSIKNC